MFPFFHLQYFFPPSQCPQHYTLYCCIAHHHHFLFVKLLFSFFLST
eukprot:UN03790